MEAIKIDGKAVSADIRNGLKPQIEAYRIKTGKEITLSVMRVGDNPASEIYVRNKIKACQEVGIRSLPVIMSADATQQEIIDEVRRLAADQSVNGILVQLPLPRGIDEQAVLKEIPREKDVDGFHAANVGDLLLGNSTIVACTPAGIMELIKSTGEEIKGKNAVVIGRSNIVGKPVALLLLQADATVTVCHSRTQNLAEIAKSADILVVAIGKSEFVTGEMVKPGAVVIDVGINRTEKGIVGDVHFDSVKDKASYLTPVPGGVGPMTIAMLLKNTVIAAMRQNG